MLGNVDPVKERPARHLVPVFQDVHEAIAGSAADPPPVLSYYPYVSTKSTIRERGGRLHLRLSDHLLDAPEPVTRGLFAILLARLRRRRIPPVLQEAEAAYERYVAGEDITARREASRRRRGRKRLDPLGEHRSLLESYLRVIMETGLALPEAPRLSWSPTASRRRFGHQDAAHDCIVISRVLDDPDVPEFVLDYVVYHELLHIAHPPVMGTGNKRIVHHKTFRQAEARYPQRKEAEAWLTRLARG